MRRFTPPSLRFLLLLAAGVLLAAAARAESLQDFWDANKAPEGEYDFVVHLDSLAVYTGGLYINSDTNCIKGHGAILDLQGATLRMSGTRTRMDIENCVILNGGIPGNDNYPAVYYANTSMAEMHVRHCTFYNCSMGLRSGLILHTASTVESCIFMNCTDWGAMFYAYEGTERIPAIHCCNSYQNGTTHPPGEGGDWSLWCGCSTPPEPWAPGGESNCLTVDPLFVQPSSDPATCDFHLSTGSPCLGTGYPAGSHMGPYQEGATAVVPSTWGGIKTIFAGG
jgi:hypothetical protein